jgi:G3E family GTPase
MRKDLDTFPVIVLTGFLGSGKTTILNQLIRDPGFKRTLVLINEFGDVGLDHDLVTQGSEDAQYVEMASGCLCCSIRGDLVRTLAHAPSRFAREGQCWFDRVLIETTGLADPAPILHTLMAEPSIMRRYELAGVVTAVDAANGERTLDMHPESVKQAAVADLLLLTKTDLTNDTTPPSLAAMLRRLNPGADQITTESADNIARRFNELGLYDPGTKTPNVERWLQEEHHHGHGSHHHHDVNRHGPDIQAFSITRSQPLPLVTLENWLDILRATLGEQLLRVKGILNVEGYERPVIIHGVQHVLHPIDVLDQWPSTDHRTRVVFITKGIEKANIERMLDAFQR